MRKRHTASLSNGQPVVEKNSSDYSGECTIAGIGWPSYYDYLNKQGISVVNGTAGYTLECTWNGTKLTCRVRSVAQ